MEHLSRSQIRLRLRNQGETSPSSSFAINFNVFALHCKCILLDFIAHDPNDIGIWPRSHEVFYTLSLPSLPCQKNLFASGGTVEPRFNEVPSFHGFFHEHIDQNNLYGKIGPLKFLACFQPQQYGEKHLDPGA